MPQQHFPRGIGRNWDLSVPAKTLLVCPIPPAGFTRASLEFLDNGELLELGSGTHWVTGEEPERSGKLLVDFFRRSAERAAAALTRPSGP